ncbi:MAG: peptidyl-prolyl cis-trans isomerase, partial [Proteobacteria bacterium]|nr:peptidyl-prolyl cis-trans isomerase [Pseudomonadota bacterium]
LERRIQRTLFDLAAVDLGLIISDDGIRQQIQNDQQFQGPGGFDRTQFRQTLHQNSLSEAGYIQLVRGDMLRQQFLSSLQVGGTVPGTLVDTVYTFRNEKRIAEVLQLNHNGFKVSQEPDSTTLAKFHKERSHEFTAPEFRKLTVVQIKAEDLAKDIVVTDEQLQKAYDERIEEFSEPEKRTVRQIIFPSEEKAREANALLQKGDPFTKVAKDIADMDAAATELGTLSKREIPIPTLADAAFALAKDKASEPVKSDLGWHILLVTDITPANTKTLDDVKADLRKLIAADTAVDQMLDIANRFDDILGTGATLEDAASRTGLTVRKIDGISALGLSPDNKEITGVNGLPQLVDVAFSTPAGETSNLTEVGGTAYFALKVEAITPPALRPLDKLRKEVVEAWKQQEQAKLAEQAAKDLAEKVKGSSDLAELAKSNKATYRLTGEFTRNGIGLKQAVPPSLVTELFKLSPGQVVTATGPTAHYVARLKDIAPARPSADKEGVTRVRAQLAQNVAQDLVQQLAGALRERHDVKIIDSNLDQIY